MNSGQNVLKTPDAERFRLVDALRGIAAVSVLFHHLVFNSELHVTLAGVLPVWFYEYCHRGAFGVQIFFVLSGFVIAHSLRNVRLTPRTVGNFMLRRQLRLDPPYWVFLLFTTALLYVEMHFPWIERKPLPDWLDVLKNMFYLQNITHSLQIVGVAWTLCLEVQFYLVFILLLLAGKYLANLGRAHGKAAAISAILVGAFGVCSLALPLHTADAWFIQSWYYFAAGALGYWAVYNPRHRLAFYAFLCLFLAVALTRDPRPMLIGWSTIVLLHIAGRIGTLGSWLNYSPLQYCGRISYSLYLSHLIVGIYVLRFGYRLTHTNPAAAIGWFLLAAIVSIAFAHVLYVLVERRSIQFAARFKPRKESASPTGETEPAFLPPQIDELETA